MELYKQIVDVKALPISFSEWQDIKDENELCAALPPENDARGFRVSQSIGDTVIKYWVPYDNFSSNARAVTKDDEFFLGSDISIKIGDGKTGVNELSTTLGGVGVVFSRYSEQLDRSHNVYINTHNPKALEVLIDILTSAKNKLDGY